MDNNHPRLVRSRSSELHCLSSLFERLEVSMKPALSALGSWPMFLAMTLWLTFYGAVTMWPASSWLEVSRLSIGNTLAGHPVPMVVTRTINRPFSGDWRVTVRRWEYNGWVVYCSAGGSNDYKTDALLPANLTLGWWTEGRCALPAVGRYTVQTSWNITPNLPFLPAKFVTIDSNIFEVTK